MKKINYFKTESNPKRNKIYKDEINQFNYRLFKINEENKKIKLDKLYLDEKELGLSLRIKSSKKDNNLHTLNSFNVNKRKNNYILTSICTNNSKKSLSNTSKKKANNISINKDIIQNSKYNMCLVPLFYQKNRLNKQNSIHKESDEKLYIKQKNHKNIFNGFLYRKIFEKNNSENKRGNETEENDMKPKIRFINLKKELLDENLKINKMFGTFQKQILETEKILKNKLRHLD